jgi:hypothetical protein
MAYRTCLILTRIHLRFSRWWSPWRQFSKGKQNQLGILSAGLCLLAAPAQTHKAQRAQRKPQEQDSLLTTDSWLLSPNHLIRSRQHVGWNHQANLLCCFQIDDQLEFRRLLDR